jgi:hypothetical protein
MLWRRGGGATTYPPGKTNVLRRSIVVKKIE